MPAGSPWATFNKARKTGITKTTKALEELYQEKPDQLVALVEQDDGLEGMHGDSEAALIAEGLDAREIEHIRNWPDSQKEDVREALKDAIEAGPDHAVRFRWKLHDGGDEDTIIHARANLTTITFYSPWSKVRLVGRDDVTVDV